MQRLKKRNQGCGFRRIQAVPVSRHVAAALQDLADQLILGETRRDGIQCRTSFAAFFAERVTVVALLALEDERPLTFECSPARQEV